MESQVSVSDLVVVGSAAIVAVAALWGGLRLVADRWRRTIGLRRINRDKLDRLAIGMYSGYLQQILGEPALAEQVPHDRPKPTRLRSAISQSDTKPERDGWIRIVRFRLKHCWISVAIGSEESVRAFSVTITAPRFRFGLNGLSWGVLGQTTLGKSTFLEIASDGPGEGCEWWIGARRTAYREVHYFGNPGMYQHFVLSANDAGLMKRGAPPPDYEGQYGMFDPSGDVIFAENLSSKIQEYRRAAAPNTVSVLRDPDAQAVRLIEVDWDAVRMFDRPRQPTARLVAQRVASSIAHKVRGT